MPTKSYLHKLLDADVWELLPRPPLPLRHTLAEVLLPQTAGPVCIEGGKIWD